MTNDLSFVNVNKGKFYAGQTVQDARREGTEKMFLHRDFTEIDRNHDGVLSVDEIMRERKHQEKSALMSFLIAVPFIAFLDGYMKKFHTPDFLDFTFDAFILMDPLIKLYTSRKGTKEIEKKLAQMKQEGKLSVNA